LPGGGIDFLVNVEKVKAGAFTWIPAPATVVPIEVTMKLADYIEIGGYLESIKSVSALREHFNQKKS
jgi:hypothetical protein